MYHSSKTGKTEKYDSSYELRRFIALDASPLVKTWTKKHGLKIRYKMMGRQHRYHPDILVIYHDGQKFVEEIKGKVWDRLAFGLKNLAAISHCAMYGMKYRVLFREQLELVV